MTREYPHGGGCGRELLAEPCRDRRLASTRGRDRFPLRRVRRTGRSTRQPVEHQGRCRLPPGRLADNAACASGTGSSKLGDVVRVTVDDERSQVRNREIALERLRGRIHNAGVVEKPRRATKPTRGSQRRRVEAKRRRGDVKKGRRRPAMRTDRPRTLPLWLNVFLTCCSAPGDVRRS